MTDLASYGPKKRMLWYGPPKCGKSGALAKVPKGSSMFVVDADRQLGEMVQAWKAIHGSFKNLEVVKLPEVIRDDDNHKKEVYKAHRAALWTPPSGFDFYAVDSWTKVGINLTHIFVGKGDRNYNKFNNQLLSSSTVDLWFQFVNKAEHQDAWSITVAWEATEEVMRDPDGSESDYRNKKLSISPKIATQAVVVIPGNCDFVWHVEKGRRLVAGKSRNVAVFRTQGTETIMASSVGFSKKLDTTVEADLSKILPLIEVAKTKPARGASGKPKTTKRKVKKWRKSTKD